MAKAYDRKYNVNQSQKYQRPIPPELQIQHVVCGRDTLEQLLLKRSEFFDALINCIDERSGELIKENR